MGLALSVADTTLTGSPASSAKMVGVSAMKPRSTEPLVSAAMTGGPPMKLAQLTVYGAPLRAFVAARIVWYAFSWSPKVMVTPASDGDGEGEAWAAPPDTARSVTARPPSKPHVSGRRLPVT